jgi:hypothetical protein
MAHAHLGRPWRTSSPWRDVAESYRAMPILGPPMIALTEHVMRAPYAQRIFGFTTHATLVVAQNA